MSKETLLYRHFDCDGKLLYIGIAKDVSKRTVQHKTSTWWAEKIVKTTIAAFPTKALALKEEKIAIEKEKPLHNIKHLKFKSSGLQIITYNLPEDICEKVSEAAIADDRSASNWLTLHLEQYFNQPS